MFAPLLRWTKMTVPTVASARGHDGRAHGPAQVDEAHLGLGGPTMR